MCLCDQIDKKAHNGRSRDNLIPLSEVLAALKPSEFADAELAHYKVTLYTVWDTMVL